MGSIRAFRANGEKCSSFFSMLSLAGLRNDFLFDFQGKYLSLSAFPFFYDEQAITV